MFTLPEHAPFPPDQRNVLASLISGFNPLQKSWLSGYLAATGLAEIPQAQTAAAPKLTVVFGTESGNSETLADRAVKEARKRGFSASMRNMADLQPSDLGAIHNLLVIVSTWGDGEPPETAAGFFNALMADGPDLGSTRFSVCALGDTSYEKFCQTGKDLDARLAVLGARRVVERQDCDVDFEDAFSSWLDRSLTALAPATPVPTAFAVPAAGVISAASDFGKKNPFPAELLERVCLNGTGSAKETLHFELSLAGSGFSYEPGDSLAVVPSNASDAVEAILQACKLSGSEEIETKNTDGPMPIAAALREKLDITALSRNVLEKLAAVTDSGELRDLLADDAKVRLKEFMAGREIVDAIERFAPSGLPAGTLAGLFRRLPPRLYSIASSPLAHPDEVHLTVAAVRYESHGRQRKGVCSTFLADRVTPGDKVPVYVQPNKNFRLPADGSVPVIMVGPGTGIAPFRAFVEHRAALGAGGRNWLFMGDQHYLYDFLYQLEWQDQLKSGVLSRLDVAFSRDQPEKVYVQHRLRQRAADVYAWLEEGAHFYVCGDATRMAADVHEALISIVQDQAAITREAAEEYVENLKKSKRYQRDVY